MLRLNAKKNRLLLSSVLTMLLTVSLFTANGLVASADTQAANAVKINSSTFPDTALRSYMLEIYPDGEISHSELESRTSLDISGKGIKSISGVELFENLQELNCSNNSIAQLSINTCHELKKLKSLDISSNASLTSLTVMGVYSNDYVIDDEWRPGKTEENYVLEDLNASGCSSLTELDCGCNKLKALDIGGCTSLKELNCDNNMLNVLDAGGCPSLTELNCNNNMLNTLDTGGCSSLAKLNCSFNNYKELDVSNCKNLKVLYCGDNCLESLDVRSLTLLEKLDCPNNKLRSLELGVKNLLSIDCSNNNLSSLDLSNVSFINTSKTSLDVEDIPLADSYGLIYCSDNLLTSLKLPENEKISVLECVNNELTELDLSKLVLVSRNGYYSSLNYDKDKVEKLLLPEYTIGKLSDKVYKGKPVKYSVTSMELKMGGHKLTKDEIEFNGFTAKYKNNKSVGIATVTIKDSNGISGTQTFRVVPSRAVIKSVKPAKRMLSVAIKKQPGGVKYQISVKKKGSKAAAKKYTVKKGLTKNIKRLKKNTKYTVKVRAFKKVKGKTYLGKWSRARTVKVR